MFNTPSVANFFLKTSLLSMFGLWIALSFSSALTAIFLWTSFVSLVCHLAVSRSAPHWPDRWLLLWHYFFLPTVLISMTVSQYPKQSFRGLFKLLQHFIILTVAFNIFSAMPTLNRWRQWVLLAFSLLVLDGMTQYFFGVDFLRGFYAQASSAGLRISASFETYGKFAAYLCSVLPVVLFCTLQSFRKRELRQELLLWIPLSLLGLFLMYSTRSRGGVLAFTFGVAIILLFRRSWKTLGVLLLVGLIGISLLPRAMVIHLDSENKEQSIVERFELWNRAWDVIRERPLTGTGINTYAVAHQQFDTRKSWRVQNYYAHNGYFQMAAEIGIPGVLFFIAFILRWLWIYRPKSFETDSDHDMRWGLFAGAVSFLIICLADTALHSPQPVMTFWFVMGLLGAAAQAKKTK